MAPCRYIAKDEKQKQDARIAELQAEACNWPQAVQLRLTALGMPPLSRVGAAGANFLFIAAMYVQCEQAGESGCVQVPMHLLLQCMSDTNWLAEQLPADAHAVVVAMHVRHKQTRDQSYRRLPRGPHVILDI